MGRVSWKLILVGGLAMYASQWIVSFATGPLIHNGVLEPFYRATESFWRPELVQEPPDMGALLPRWVTVGILASLLTAFIYGGLRSAFNGAGWKKGLQFGLVVWLLSLCWNAGFSGIFNLPDAVWFWWSVEGLLYYAIGGIVLGWVGGKLAPEPA